MMPEQPRRLVGMTDKGLAVIALAQRHADQCAVACMGLEDDGWLVCLGCGWAATPPDPREN